MPTLYNVPTKGEMGVVGFKRSIISIVYYIERDGGECMHVMTCLLNGQPLIYELEYINLPGL